MFPNTWTTSVPPPAITKPIVNSYENTTQSYPFYTAPNAVQNIPMNQQNQLTLSSPSVAQSLPPNAIDPALVQKWQEWKRWELWQQQFQQWQQQTGQIATAATQPPIPSNQPLQPPQPPVAFQNHQYPYNQSGPPMPINNQPQQIITNNEVGIKRGSEIELQSNEKKIKFDVTSKKEIELNVEMEKLFEDQFKSWEEQFLKWKEQNKNHPDKAQYLEYEKKWLNWRDHLKQKCEVLKKKREQKMAEKKLNTSILPPTSESQIPGLDLVSSNEDGAKNFLNVSKILPQNQKGPIQTPDDKPFNFPKSVTNTAPINPHPINMPFGNTNLLSQSMYPNSSNWHNYNNSLPYYNQKPPDIENSMIPRFGQQTNITSRPPCGVDIPNTVYNSAQNLPDLNQGMPFNGSYNKPSSEASSIYHKTSDDPLSYNRNFNTSYNRMTNNFHSYNQPNINTSNFDNFNKPSDNSNIPYQKSKPSLNTTPAKLPSLLSLNLVKPIALEKSGNYSENKDVTSHRYERDWNVADEEDDPESEYMEAHKKFSSEPFDNQNNDQFLNKQQRSMYNENYSRGQQNLRNFNEDHPRQLNQSREFQMMNFTDNNYSRPNSQFSRNINQNYSSGMQTSKNNGDDYYKIQNNTRNMKQEFSRGVPHSRNIDEDYSNEPTSDKNNFVSQKGKYGSPYQGNYDKPLVKDTPIPPPYEAPPIDPVKIFDYRHLPTLKVIPGLCKDSMIPIRIYDYKHGGKRILPWQDRGFSRRNSNHTRDLNEKSGSSQYNFDDFNNKIELLNEESTFHSLDFSSNEAKSNLVDYENTEIKEKISPLVNKISSAIDLKEKEIKSPLDTQINNNVPSPPRMSKNTEIEKLSNRQVLPIETLLCPPGRYKRPSKIIIILRGLPGSGKSHIAKLIKEKEVSMGGQAPRILSLDDYFMTEVTKTEIDPETNKKVDKKVMEYEHDSVNENLYRTSFIKSCKKKILENYFSFYILDAINNKVSYYNEILDVAQINGFTVYIIELESNIDLCIKHNIHNRTPQDINSLMKSWIKTPDDQVLLDIQSLLHSPSKSEIEMEDVSDVEMELDKNEDTPVDNNKLEETTNFDLEEEDIDVMKLLSCKWVDTIPQEEKMKRLDGLCKKKPESSIKEWLQIPEDNYTINEQEVIKDGKKRVRWADIEERREQEKMRAIGFVVGQTDWDRMLGRDQGESKLTQTKYI